MTSRSEHKLQQFDLDMSCTRILQKSGKKNYALQHTCSAIKLILRLIYPQFIAAICRSNNCRPQNGLHLFQHQTNAAVSFFGGLAPICIFPRCPIRMFQNTLFNRPMQLLIS